MIYTYKYSIKTEFNYVNRSIIVMVNNVDNPCNFLRIGLTLARKQKIYFLIKVTKEQ